MIRKAFFELLGESSRATVMEEAGAGSEGFWFETVRRARVDMLVGGGGEEHWWMLVGRECEDVEPC